MKVILSHGQGKIHFFESSKAIKECGAEVKIISGWRPKNIPRIFRFILEKLTGRNDLHKRLSVRNFDGLTREEIIDNSKSEFFYRFLLVLNKIHILPKIKAEVWGWKYLGYSSKKYITNSEIFHVRSGAGQGGAIEKAKKEGMIVIADHSIAHPKAIEDVLKSEYLKFKRNLEIKLNDPFWQLVLKDCNDADYILVNSDYVKETFVKNGFNPQKIKVIYLGVREDFFQLKKEYTLGKEIKLLFTGTFDLRKGANTIIDALNILSYENIVVSLDIIGEFPTESRILLDKLVNKNMVTVHGSILQDELKSFLKKSDIYIFPTFAEGSAKSAMEAMAAGLPVITTDNCGVPIVNMKNGIIIPVDNPVLLAKNIDLLAKNDNLREKLGTIAASTIKNCYTWNDYGQNLIRFYIQILS